MISLISDIHGNTEALSVVFGDIDRRGVKAVYCLGDVIGYGPEPRQCLDTVIDRCELSLMGNHEHGAMFIASDFNPKARSAIEWTKEQLNDPDSPRQDNFRFWNYISEMTEKQVVCSGEVLLAHGSPRDPVREYMLPDDANDGAKMRGCYERMGAATTCFVGHSHVPGIYVEGESFRSPEECAGGYALGERRAIINVGSVGQPRDGDPRASYASYDETERVVHFHRLAYDVEATMAKIRETALPDYLADRLAVGR